MKNIIAPEILAKLKEEPISLKNVVDFLDNNEDITTSALCKILGIDPQRVYSFRSGEKKKRPRESLSDRVRPKWATKGQDRFSPEEKYELVESYFYADEQDKSMILRKYGIYNSDILRWKDQIRIASIEALGKRKIRSDKKTDDQLKIEKLEKELKEQEKTTAKLSTLLILQKKTFDILKGSY